tara:strand:- start:5058 stop:6275 length:1218 start_codon:yes stop_codon:yes gene_type:complete
LPLFRHSLAAGNCRYVGIASPTINAHTRDMLRPSKKNFLSLIGSLAMLFALGAEARDKPIAESQAPVLEAGVDSKHILVSQAQRWVADNRQLPQSRVEVAPSDRRLIVPFCESAFEFNYPFATSHRTVRASCPESGWQIFLGIDIHQPENALRYTGSFKADHQLSSGDVELVSLPSSIAGLASDARTIEGYSLSTAVRAGDLVMQRQLSSSIEVYKLTRAVVAGETIGRENIEVVIRPSANVPESQVLSLDRLSSARAARNLATGKILSNYDIKEKHQVLITQFGIARGQVVTRTSIAMQDYYGKLPQDSLQDYSSAERMQAIRNLAAGSLLRLSDLTPVNIIRKGDNVQLVLRAGALEITATMLALEDARMDQRVLLLNPESGEEIQAIAAGVGRARSLGSAAK